MEGFICLVVEVAVFFDFRKEGMPHQEIRVNVNSKSLFFQLHIHHANELVRFHKVHRATVVVILCLAVQDHAGFQLLQRNNIEITRDFHVLQRVVRFPKLVHADQWVFRGRKTLRLI